MIRRRHSFVVHAFVEGNAVFSLQRLFLKTPLSMLENWRCRMYCFTSDTRVKQPLVVLCCMMAVNMSTVNAQVCWCQELSTFQKWAGPVAEIENLVSTNRVSKF